MKQRSFFATFAQYVSLNIAAAVGVSLYILADTLFIANGIGSIGLSALNLALPLYNVVSGLGLMLGIGCSSYWSILRVSKHSEEKATAVFQAAIFLALLLGAVFTILGLGFSGSLSRLLGADAEVYPLTKTYLTILLAFSPLFLLQNVLVAFVRNDDAPSTAMLATLSGCLFNIIMDFILVFPCGLGMAGAALATVGSPLCGIVICTVHLLRKKGALRLIGFKIKVTDSITALRAGFTYGVAAFINELCAGTVMAVYNFVILSISGNIGIASYGIIANLAIVVLSIYTGITQGIQPLCSTAYGKCDHHSLKKALCSGILLSVGISVLIFVAAVLNRIPIIELFSNTEQLTVMTAAGFTLYFIGFLPAGCNILLSAYAASIGKTAPAVLITLLRGIALISLFVILLGNLFGMTGVWIAFPITEYLTLLAATILLCRTNKTPAH